jgi:Cu/Ag efflux protein CusF
MMKGYVATLVSLCGLLACSSEQETASPAPFYQSSREVSTVATVESVDVENRKITLKGLQGNTITCDVDERVRNLDHVQPGDQINLTYVQAAAVRVVKKAEHSQDDFVIDQAPPGEKPRGKRVRQVSLTAEVSSIDRQQETVTLKGADGSLTTIRVRHPERLENIKVGDLLQITYSEAVAVSVQPSPGEVR